MQELYDYANLHSHVLSEALSILVFLLILKPVSPGDQGVAKSIITHHHLASAIIYVTDILYLLVTYSQMELESL